MARSKTIASSRLSRVLNRLASIAVFSTLAIGSAAQAQSVKLTFATGMPAVSPIVKSVWEAWANEANAGAQGEFVIEVVNGFTLANPSNMWERTASGVIDIGFGLQGASGLPFAKTTVASLPLVFDDPVKASAALWRLHERGLLGDEYKAVKVLGLAALPIQGISSSKPIRSLDDLAGVKMRAVDKVAADVATALGAAPISVPSNEVYQALSRGVVQAAVVNWLMIGAFKVGEVAPQHQRAVPLGAVPAYLIMNHGSYNKLTPKGKALFDKYIGELAVRKMALGHHELAVRIEAGVKADGKQTILTLPDAEKAKWEARLQTVIESWTTRTDNGKAILAAFREELAKTGK